MSIDSFYHVQTGTWTHLISIANEAAIIDAVLDYDQRSGNTSTEFADGLLAKLAEHRCHLGYVWETHVHADHLSAAAYLKQKTGARIGVGAGIRQVQNHFQKLLNLSALTDGIDELLQAGDALVLGDARVNIIAAKGHTADSICFAIDDSVFIGDTLFAPDVGSARCDFPGGSAQELFDTAQILLALPAETKLYLGHDYPPCIDSHPIRKPMACTTVAEQRARNIHINAKTTREAFVAMREKRDAGLAAPNLLWPALKCNIRGGLLPDTEANGVSYLKIPVNKFKC